MHKLLTIVAAALMLILCACSNIGQDPTRDGREMVDKYLSAMNDGDTDKASAIAREYYDIYKEKSMDDRLAFGKAATGAVFEHISESGAEGIRKLKEQAQPLLEELKKELDQD